MAAKKGTRPKNAPRGRRKGAVNKTTRTLREWITKLVEHGMQTAEVDYDRIKDPAKKLALLATFSDFVIPRLQRSEFVLPPSGSDGPPITVTDAIQASRMYAEAMAGRLDASRVVFKVPARPPLLPPEPPRLVHEHEARADSLCSLCRKLHWESRVEPQETPPVTEQAPDPLTDEGVTVVAEEAARPHVVPHVHQRLADSNCRHCRQLWVNS